MVINNQYPYSPSRRFNQALDSGYQRSWFDWLSNIVLRLQLHPLEFSPPFNWPFLISGIDHEQRYIPVSWMLSQPFIHRECLPGWSQCTQNNKSRFYYHHFPGLRSTQSSHYLVSLGFQSPSTGLHKISLVINDQDFFLLSISAFPLYSRFLRST